MLKSKSRTMIIPKGFFPLVSKVLVASSFSLCRAYDPCYVCGENRHVGNASGVIDVSDHPFLSYYGTVLCGELDYFGVLGYAPPTMCRTAFDPKYQVQEICQCKDLEENPCYICGEGLEISNPNGFADLSSLPYPYSAYLNSAYANCGDLEEYALQGYASEDLCAYAQDEDYAVELNEACQCVASSPTAAPTFPERQTICELFGVLCFNGCGVIGRVLGLCNE